jgi:hypothetical protein
MPIAQTSTDELMKKIFEAQGKWQKSTTISTCVTGVLPKTDIVASAPVSIVVAMQ